MLIRKQYSNFVGEDARRNILFINDSLKYVSGDIDINKNEIEFAGWFDKNNLPKLPDTMTIARHLIEQHLKRQN